MNTPHPTVNWVKNRVRQARDDQQQLFDAGLNGLQLVKREGKVIELGNGEQLTEFLSCSYLGLESDPRLIQGAVQAVEFFGVQFAAARTRALLPPMRELDEQLNRIFQGAYGDVQLGGQCSSGLSAIAGLRRVAIVSLAARPRLDR